MSEPTSEPEDARRPSPPPMPKWPEEDAAATPDTIPAKLQRAVWLMYAGAVLTLASIPLNLADREQMAAGLRDNPQGQRMSEAEINAFIDAVYGLTIVLGLIGAGLWLLMAVFNKRGKNWARLTASGLGLLNVMFNLWLISGAVQAGASLLTPPAMVSILIFAVSIVALVYLWNPGVRDWFERQRSTTD